jgi:peptidoglycan/LPS O-acetylase OafA/YrhL
LNLRGSIAERLEATRGRPAGFDILRLVAASAVVFHHAFGVEHDVVHDDILFRHTQGSVHFGILSVEIFFVISGFLLTLSALRIASLPIFVIRRMARIFPGLIAVVAISVFVIGPLITQLSLKDYFSNSTTYGYLINMLTLFRRYLPGIYDAQGVPIVFGGSMWTLQYEVGCYLVLSAAIAFGQVTRAGILAIFVLAFATYIAGNENLVHLPDRLTTLASLAVYFFAGSLVAVCAGEVYVSLAAVLVAVALLVATSQLHIFIYLLVFFISYFVIVFGAFGFGLPAMMKNVDISYGIYLWHCPLLTIYLTRNIWLPWPALALLLLGGAAVIAYVSWILIEHRSIGWAHSFGKRFQAVGKTAVGKTVVTTDPIEPARGSLK